MQAHDQRLDRTVAIKESLTPDARFQREVAITARLQHPSIVPVHDAGHWKSGAPYYVMKLLGGGRTLKQRMAETPTLDGRLALLPHIIAVADAIAYAHSLDIIHRDLKPSNVLLGPFGETLVIDWGLAKDLARPDDEPAPLSSAGAAAAPELSAVGAIIGTPQFMAPEQARGEPADKRADVYALGALLYCVLANEAPYPGGSSVEVLARVRTQDPIALDQLVKGVPRDLDALVRKAMARRPEDRYADARELVDDLKRFQTGQLVRAHEYSSATLLARWVARHRAPLTVALLFLVASGALAALGVRRLARARDAADRQRAVADRERAAAVAKRNELILLQARSSLAEDPTQTLAWLKSYPLDGSDWMTVQSLASQARALGVARYVLPTHEVANVNLLADGTRLVTAPANLPRLELWDTVSGQRLDQLALDSSAVAMRHGRDGATIALGLVDGQIALWNVDTRQLVRIGKNHGTIEDLRFSPDEQLLAAVSLDELRLWNLRDGSSRALPGRPSPNNRLQFGDGGRLLYSLGPNGTLLRTSVADGRTRSFTGHRGDINGISVSADGTLIATAGSDGTVRVWPISGAAPQVIAVGTSPVRYVRFVPGSRRLVSQSEDRTAALWEPDGRLVQRLPPMPDLVWQFDVSLDGAMVAVAGRGFVLLWDLATGETRLLRGYRNAVFGQAIGRDGTVVAGGAGSQTRVWPKALRAPLPRRVHHFAESLTRVVFSPDGAYYAAEGARTVYLCAAATDACRSLTGHHGFIYGLDFSSDSRWLVSAGWDGTARLWDVASGRSRALPIGGARVNGVRFLPDGGHVALAGSDGVVYVWPTDGGAPTLLRGHVREVAALAVTPDGRTVVSGGDDRTVRAWDWRSGSGRVLGRADAAVTIIDLSPDGRLAAVGDLDGVVRLWDLGDGSSRVVTRYRGAISKVSFSPDGRSLASSSTDGRFAIFELASQRSQTNSEHDARMRSVIWSPDGRLLATCSDDRTVRLWDVASGAVTVLAGHTGSVRRVAFSPDGKTLASASDDRTLRLWDVASNLPAIPREPKALAAWMNAATNATP